ncbi:MAG: TIGR03546 family protein [Gemmatimonadales bacterium]
MLTLLKLLQSFIKTLHSEGSPGQIAAGVALGAALGLTPLLNLHNLVILSLIIILNVSFAGGMLGLALFTPLGFLLDPVFDRAGHALLLDTPALTPLWTVLYNVPGVPYTNFNNTVVLGSFVCWVLLAVPIFFAARYGVLRYRATLGERVRASRLYQAITASKVYNVYRWFRPD